MVELYQGVELGDFFSCVKKDLALIFLLESTVSFARSASINEPPNFEVNGTCCDSRSIVA